MKSFNPFHRCISISTHDFLFSNFLTVWKQNRPLVFYPVKVKRGNRRETRRASIFSRTLHSRTRVVIFYLFISRSYGLPFACTLETAADARSFERYKARCVRKGVISFLTSTTCATLYRPSLCPLCIFPSRQRIFLSSLFWSFFRHFIFPDFPFAYSIAYYSISDMKYSSANIKISQTMLFNSHIVDLIKKVHITLVNQTQQRNVPNSDLNVP